MAKPYLLQELENKEEKVFYAIYNETTYEELLEAYNAKKIIIVRGVLGYSYCMLETYNEEDSYFKFKAVTGYGLSPIYTAYCRKNGEELWTILDSIEMQGFNTIEPCTSTATNIPINSSTKYFRPILISPDEPTPDDGDIGDVWIKYST